jgi:signal transduction histidine kinase
MGVVAVDGPVLCSALPLPVATTFAGRSWLNEVLATRRIVISEPVIGRVVNKPIVVVAYPHVVNGELRHVLFGSIDLNSLAIVAGHAPLPGGTVLTLIGPDGTVLARHPDPESWVGRRVRDEPLARAAIEPEDGRATVRGLDGVNRYYSFLAMPGSAASGAYLAVGIPQATALAVANEGLRRSILILLLVLLAALLLSRFTAQRLFVKPTEALVDAADRLREGDLSARSGIPRHHEGGRLGAAFDAMAVRFEEQTIELERSRQHFQLLTRRTEERIENERRRIARTVHDDLGQALTALTLDTSWIARRINGEDPAIGEHMRSMHTLLETTAATVRRISTELRPSVLDDLGLDAAVEWQAQEFSRQTDIPSEVRLHVDRATLPPAVAIALFRILQEALTNVVRHAAATRVAISLSLLPERAILEVRDDGVGFPAETDPVAPSLGLLGMRERARTLGGSASFESAQPRGTIVRADIPLDDATPVDGLP